MICRKCKCHYDGKWRWCPKCKMLTTEQSDAHLKELTKQDDALRIQKERAELLSWLLPQLDLCSGFLQMQAVLEEAHNRFAAIK